MQRDVSTIAGLAGTLGSTDGTGAAARCYYPTDVATDSYGNLYVSDSSNNAIRIGRAALAGNFTIDRVTGAVGFARQLGSTSTAATTWRREMATALSPSAT